MSQTKQIMVAGAANVDIIGFPEEKLVMHDANIGNMEIVTGGVGRNIAHNLSLLDFDVYLATLFGDDPLSKFLIKSCNKDGIHISDSLLLKNQKGSNFIAILDETNDLAVGISAMEIFNEENGHKLVENILSTRKSDYFVLETNLDKNSLQQLVTKFKGSKFVLDTVSGKKAERAKPILPDLYILKTNQLEAEVLSGIKIKNTEDLSNTITFFLEKGVQKVFVTLGKDGVIYGDKNGINKKTSIASKVINTIGAGDAFVAGLIYADSLQLPIDQMALYGMAAAAITVQNKKTVNPALNPKKLKEILANAQ
jgi:pseudouridine kinase